MSVHRVLNSGTVETSGLSVSGANGKKLSKEETKLATALAGMDGKPLLSMSDIEKLKNMSPADQIKYINNALKDTGYQVAPVHDFETDEVSPGVTWTSDGVYINFSKDGKTIGVDQMGNSTENAGFLGITFNKK